MSDDETKKPDELTIVEEPVAEEPKKHSVIEPACTAPDAIDEEYEHEPQFTEFEKADFAALVAMLDTLHMVFKVYEQEEPSYRFMTAWNACLALAGWSEDEFWACYDNTLPCDVCGGEMGEEDDEELPAIKPEVPNKLAN